ncbi:hypothetical protein TNCT_118511 [Trichonephila clavata]|uniref:Uncharacterized protein n=1 Tax=Trichonephila clavata TaxID=2740835 RepID=A0A8X6K9X2_TRICU|nr:hypothetical protein TNCT_118511 [Trichonephila clavata]
MGFEATTENEVMPIADVHRKFETYSRDDIILTRFKLASTTLKMDISSANFQMAPMWELVGSSKLLAAICFQIRSVNLLVL